MKKQKVIVVMPAYNAAKTLIKTYHDIPLKSIDDILLVDDASQDGTIKIAKKLGLKYKIHKKNKGYGGNQKTCYKEALKLGADIVIMLHPDYQYDPKLIPMLIAPIQKGYFDIMLGSRIHSRTKALEGGMPLYKYISNRFLTFLENLVLGLNLSEYHTGYRAFTARVLRNLPIEKFSDDFIFDQEILIAAHQKGFTIGEITVPVKYFAEASSISFSRSARYGLLILVLLFKYIFQNLFFTSRGTRRGYLRK